MAQSSQYVRIFELIKKDDDDMTELLKVIVIHGCSRQLFLLWGRVGQELDFSSKAGQGVKICGASGAVVKPSRGETCIPAVNNIMR